MRDRPFFYSVLSATTGSFLAALLAGARPEMSVRPMLRRISSIAFEVGRAAIGKGGIIKDESARLYAVEKVTAFAKSVGFECLKTIKSPIKGGDGNVEFLAHFKKILV